jgi:GAF domain-containing protein
VHQPTRNKLADTVRRGLAGWVFRNGKPALVEDTQRDPRWLPLEWDDPQGSPRSAISVPLLAGDQVMGVLTLVKPDTRRFTQADLAQLSAIAANISHGARHVGLAQKEGDSSQQSEGEPVPLEREIADRLPAAAIHKKGNGGKAGSG